MAYIRTCVQNLGRSDGRFEITVLQIYNRISVSFVALANTFFTSTNMLVSKFNIVITTPFTAVLMVYTSGFLQHHS